jgi:ferredoxin--NADP+ reductase
MSAFNTETVTSVHHWTERLFSFQTTRDPSFRFLNGQFTMIGLEVEGRPLMRAYSLASANYEEGLEFLSIKVPDGPLTSRLQNIQEGDKILVGRKPVGTLVADSLLPGKNLYLLGTGTGLAPFMAIIKDPEIYERFEHVVLCHGVRQVAELAYADYIQDQLPNDELIGEIVAGKLLYYPTVTREPFRNRGRLTDLIAQGTIASDLDLPAISKEDDRFMLCGSPELLTDMTAWLRAEGFQEGSHTTPAQFVVEKAFVEK